MAATTVLVALTLALPVAYAQSGSAQRRGERAPEQSFVSEGIAVDFAVRQIAGAPGTLREGHEANVRFRVRDAHTGSPVAGLRPAAWIDARERPGTDASTCSAKVRSFMNASLSARPAVDLNTYYVLALNDDASISVVNPLFGFGGSKLLTTVLLSSPGHDWVLSADGTKLYVALAMAGKVAVVDTAAWKVASDIQVGGHAARLALQPDGRYLWIASESTGAAAGSVVVLDTAALRLRARFTVGAGRQDIVFSGDARFAFVSSGLESGTVTVIDIPRLAKLADVRVGPHPSALAVSELSRAVYAASEGDGSISVIDMAEHTVTARIAGRPGVRSVAVAPGGRWGLSANRSESTVSIFDTATSRVVHTVPVGEHPEQITFTANTAFLRSARTELVSMINLRALEHRDPPSVLDFPGGQALPGDAINRARAASIVPAPGGDSVLVANALDKTIYYYTEGMAAPMGSFRNYGRSPRALLVADRGFRETEPGVYSAAFTLPPAATYDVAFAVGVPRLLHCFDLDVSADPVSAARRAKRLAIEPLIEQAKVRAGVEAKVRFRALDPATNRPIDNLRDMAVLIFRAPGLSRATYVAKADAGGAYEVAFTPAEPGVYFVFFECRSLNVRYNELPHLILTAVPAEDTAPVHKGA